MRSGTRQGVSKWLRRKDRYIGRLYSDIGKVPSDSVIFRSTGELREYGEEVYGPYWALGERERRGCAPPRPIPNWTRGRGGAPSFLLFPLPLPCLLLLLHRREGILLLVGVGLLPGAPPPGRPPLPLAPLYTGAGGTSRHTS